jgi:gliding motility-associated-like protein
MRKAIIFILLILTFHGVTYAQDYTNIGTDFWVGFLDNCDIREGNEMFTLFATGPNAATITINNPNTGWSTTFTITPNTIGSTYIPMAQAYDSTSCLVHSKGLHVTSTTPVSIYYSTRGVNNLDVASVLPSSSLGSCYMVQSYPSDRWGSEFVIVAAEDSVWVDILLTDSTSTGDSAGTTLHVYLPSAGNSYQVKTGAIGDLSGSRIMTRNCKHIAVFHGDACPYIPDYTDGKSCDHSCEQAIPFHYWGNKFIVKSSTMQLGDRVLVTALEDSCTIVKNGITVQSNIMSGQTYTYTMTSTSPADYITTTKAASVAVFFASTYNTIDRLGDPSMVTIQPLGQWLHQAFFGCFHDFPSTEGRGYHANIITKQSDIAYLQLDGNSIAASNFTTLSANSTYAYADISLTAGPHRLTASQGGGFLGYIYGLSTLQSFAYTLGGTLPDENITTTLSINGSIIDSLSDTIKICLGDTVTLSVVIDSAHTLTKWNLGNGTILTGDTVHYCYSQGGSYRVTAQSSSLVNNIWDTCHIVTLSLQFNINVHVPNVTIVCDTIQSNQLPWSYRGKTYDHAVVGDTIIIDDSNNCTDYILYTLVVLSSPIPITYVDTLICEEELPYTWHGHLFDTAGSFGITFSGTGGADSTVIYRLFTHSCNGNLDDSLHHPYSLWAPNIFTPSEGTNNRFRIFSSGLASVTVTIFNRNGAMVCQFDGLTESWDGKHKGVPCKQDAYVYLIEYRTIATPAIPYKKVGTVTLLR